MNRIFVYAFRGEDEVFTRYFSLDERDLAFATIDYLGEQGWTPYSRILKSVLKK